VDETHALFEIPAAEKVNHVCVFLLGTGQSFVLIPPLNDLSHADL
jgi:hypothetical protein